MLSLLWIMSRTNKNKCNVIRQHWFSSLSIKNGLSVYLFTVCTQQEYILKHHYMLLLLYCHKTCFDLNLLSQLLQVFSCLGCLGQQRKKQVMMFCHTKYPPTLHLHVSWQSVTCYCSLSVKNNSGVQPAGQCGTWVKESEGGLFTSPNYPNKYPPERECIYIIEGTALFPLDLTDKSVMWRLVGWLVGGGCLNGLIAQSIIQLVINGVQHNDDEVNKMMCYGYQWHHQSFKITRFLILLLFFNHFIFLTILSIYIGLLLLWWIFLQSNGLHIFFWHVKNTKIIQKVNIFIITLLSYQ